MTRIDLNSDIGEACDHLPVDSDDAVLEHVTSANIACGFHAGDPTTMQRTVAAALRHGVAIGAHPSLADRAGFGRRETDISPHDAYALVVYQVGALAALAHAAGARLAHVKPHGALYNMAARDPVLAAAIAQAVTDVDASLVLVGLAGSALPAAGARLGLRVAHEAFADRAYEADGRLSPRGETGAVIDDIERAVVQAVAIATRGEAVARSGETVRIRADTLCVHGDRADAGEFARRLRAGLFDAGVDVRAPRQAGATAG